MDIYSKFDVIVSCRLIVCLSFLKSSKPANKLLYFTLLITLLNDQDSVVPNLKFIIIDNMNLLGSELIELVKTGIFYLYSCYIWIQMLI